MADLKVNDGGTVKTPERIFTVGASNTLYQVNYVVANNASQTPVTVWDAIFATSRTTTFDTSNTTSTSFTTTFATTRDTTQTTSTSFTTSFSTTASTSASTTTTFQTGHQTTTTFNTSKSTTTSYSTSFATSRSTSRSTTGSWGSYQYSYPSTYTWATSITSGTPGSSSYTLYWNGSIISSGGGAGTGAATTTLMQVGATNTNVVASDILLPLKVRHQTTTIFEEGLMARLALRPLLVLVIRLVSQLRQLTVQIT